MSDSNKDLLIELMKENIELRKKIDSEQDGNLSFWRERAWKWQYMFETLAMQTAFDLNGLTQFQHSDSQRPDPNPEKTTAEVNAAMGKATKSKPKASPGIVSLMEKLQTSKQVVK